MISFRLNGRIVPYDGPAEKSLLRALRDTYRLTGTKCGCEAGECGACTVIFNGHLAHACAVAMGQAAGGEVITIEGFRETPHFEVLARAFEDCGVDAGGFALPGLILAAQCILARHPEPTEAQIRAGLAGNRCAGGYGNVVAAIQKAGKEGGGLW